MITLVYNCFAKDAGNQLSCFHQSHMNVCTTEIWSNLPKTRFVEQMSSLLYHEIKHFDWMLKGTWLLLSNQVSLLRLSIVTPDSTNSMGSISVLLTSCLFCKLCLCWICNRFVCFVKSKPVKQEVGCTVIIFPMVCVLWLYYPLTSLWHRLIINTTYKIF